jgi:hypothetical protein
LRERLGKTGRGARFNLHGFRAIEVIELHQAGTGLPRTNDEILFE